MDIQDSPVHTSCDSQSTRSVNSSTVYSHTQSNPTENLGVYNNILEYGRRAFGKTITVINRSVFLSCPTHPAHISSRSEVVGRPLAALLANDGARVFSADENGIVEYTRRKAATDGSTPPAWAPHYVTENCSMQLKDCLAISDVVISGRWIMRGFSFVLILQI